MRKLFAWLAGLASVAALAKILHRRRADGHVEEEHAGAIETDADPAAELRRKLDEVRTGGTAAASIGDATPPPEAAPSSATEDETARSLDERRAAIHAKAQEAIDAMREDAP
ncbi:MAG: hypothetical protein ACRC50_09810 [Gaiella sp.]